jgi:hypothetical protein
VRDWESHASRIIGSPNTRRSARSC